MTDNSHTEICSLCLEYVAGCLTESDKRLFERHLDACDACRRELDDLQIVWEALPLDVGRIEPPEDLKGQVMSAAKRIKPRRFGGQSRYRIPSASAAALFIILMGVGIFYNYRLYDTRVQQPPTLELALGVSASQLDRLGPLKALAPEKEGAYGVACVVDNGKSRQFVVYVFGAAPTAGNEAYQVWLIKDGKRQSAGTFRVTGENGIGLLSMSIGAGRDAEFDDIGITLEPDDRADHPRGGQVFGTV
jgi:anti-sigma-K factor RskA